MSDAIVCPSCKKRLKGPREPGMYRCKPCGSTFYIPPSKEKLVVPAL